MENCFNRLYLIFPINRIFLCERYLTGSGFKRYIKNIMGNSHGIMAKELNCNLEVSVNSSHAYTFTFELIQLEKV